MSLFSLYGQYSVSDLVWLHRCTYCTSAPLYRPISSIVCVFLGIRFSFYNAAFFSSFCGFYCCCWFGLFVCLFDIFFLLFLALFSIDLSIFISVSQSIQFNIEFSSFHLNLFDCHSGVFFVRLCCNSIFLRMWIYFCSIIMITRCCGSASHCQRTESTLTNFISLSSML